MIIDKAKRVYTQYKVSIIALIMCIITLGIALILHPVYETNDDPTMENLLYGSYGEKGTSFLVFINRILSCILFFLVSLFPKINWYITMHYVACLFSMFILAKVFIRKSNKNGIFISVLVLAASLETLYSVQFTKTAALASISGMIGLIDELHESRNNRITVLSCIGLILLGSMIRFESFLLVSLIFIVVYISKLRNVIKTRKNKIKQYIIFPVIILSLVMSVYVIGKALNNNTPGAAEFYKYNSCRATLTDYYRDYDPTSDSYSEFLMVSNWMNNDPEVFTTEKLEKMCGEIETNSHVYSVKALIFLATYLPYMIQHEPLLIIALVATILLILFSKKKAFLLPLFIIYIFIEWYLICNGRYYVHRVHFGIHFALLISMMYLGNISFDKTKTVLKRNMENKVMPIIMLLSIIFAGLVSVYFCFLEYESENVKNKYLDIVIRNTDYQYMIHPLAQGINKKNNIFDLPQNDNINGNFSMGGWTEGINIPGLDRKNACKINGNPWVECIDSSTIRLVLPRENGYIYLRIIALYIQDHYYKNVYGVPEYENNGVIVYRLESFD